MAGCFGSSCLGHLSRSYLDHRILDLRLRGENVPPLPTRYHQYDFVGQDIQNPEGDLIIRLTDDARERMRRYGIFSHREDARRHDERAIAVLEALEARRPMETVKSLYPDVFLPPVLYAGHAYGINEPSIRRAMEIRGRPRPAAGAGPAAAQDWERANSLLSILMRDRMAVQKQARMAAEIRARHAARGTRHARPVRR